MAAEHPPIALIGPMAAGKSSLGRKLARELGREFVDTDRRVVAKHGPIPVIFDSVGDAGFRELEADAVAEALSANRVVALGGGAVLHAQTRSALLHATVIYVTIDERTAAARIEGTSRPLLVEGGIEAWKRIAAERAPLYEDLADVTIDASGRPLAALVAELSTWLKEEDR